MLCAEKIELLQVPCQIEQREKTLSLHIDQYKPTLIQELQASCEGIRGSMYQWTMPASGRNLFTLDLLSEGAVNGWSDRYKRNAEPELPWVPNRPLRSAQLKMTKFMITVLQGINAGEMGIGKTLATFEAIEYFRQQLRFIEGPLWWVAPRAGLVSVMTQMVKWKFYTMGRDAFFNYSQLENQMKAATVPPQIVVFDESAALKIPASRRTQLAISLAIAMDEHWGDRCSRLLLTGTPQPESYFDWWSQLEIARPGWLREKSRQGFEKRLAIFGWADRQGGGSYPVFQKWKDAEVAKLPARLDGVVLPLWKKDHMDLPEKVYDVITVQPTLATLRVARALSKRVESAAELQTKLRQLSDGFQYVTDEETDARSTQIGETPKDQVVLDLLEEYEPMKRFILYAGFQASVDRCAALAAKAGWKVWQFDGRGQLGNVTETMYQDIVNYPEKICFVGNPESAGIALTLTPSPIICYFSNSFKGVYRTQSEDRFHREGATKERGCRIVDIVHLPTDEKVIEAVKNKRDAERMTLHEILDALGRDE